MTVYEKLVTDLIDAARQVSAAADTPDSEGLARALVWLDDCLYRHDRFQDDPEDVIEQAFSWCEDDAAELKEMMEADGYEPEGETPSYHTHPPGYDHTRDSELLRHSHPPSEYDGHGHEWEDCPDAQAGRTST